MKLKVLVILLVALGASFGIPALRQHVEPVADAALAPAKRLLDRQLARIRDPVFRWSVQNEARGIARDLQQIEETGQALPRPQDFQSYLQGRTLAGAAVLDRWGSPYYLLLTGDSIVVVSPGPDQRPGNTDDIRAGLPRL